MSKITELVENTLGLDQHQWEGLKQETRDMILRLCDPVNLEDPKKESKNLAAEGIRKVLNLAPQEYDKLEDWERERFLKKLDDIGL